MCPLYLWNLTFFIQCYLFYEIMFHLYFLLPKYYLCPSIYYESFFKAKNSFSSVEYSEKWGLTKKKFDLCLDLHKFVPWFLSVFHLNQNWGKKTHVWYILLLRHIWYLKQDIYLLNAPKCSHELLCWCQLRVENNCVLIHEGYWSL